MIKIPNTNKQWAYSTSSDVMGNVVNCHNVTFDKQGYATLNNKMGEVYGDGTNVGTVTSIVYNSIAGQVHAVTDDKTHSASPTESSNTPIFTRETSTNASIPSNGVLWNGYTLYPRATAVDSWDGTTNTNRIGSLTSSDFHPLCSFESANKLAVGDVNVVKLYNTSWTLDSTNQLTIPANYTVTWIKFVGKKLYIGTKSNSSENAKMFIWNGTGTSAEDAFDVGGVWSWCGEVYGSTVVQVNSRAQIMQYTGNGFSELASFPVYYLQQVWRDSSGYTGGKVMVDGIKVDGDNIFLNIDGSVTPGAYEQGGTENKYIPEQPSGVWCYDPKVGLYPFALMSKDLIKELAITGVNTTTNTFTVSAHSFKSGDKVRYSAAAASTGLTSLQIYFIIYVSSTEFKLANTYDEAIAGTAVDVTASGTTEKVMGYYHTDFGHATINRQGALAFFKELQAVPNSIYAKYLISGANILNTDLSTTRKSICSLQKNENRGSLTTPKISSQALTDNYKYLTVKYNNILSGNDKIIVKMRTIDKSGMPFVSLNESRTSDAVFATWASTSSFTITSPAFANVAIGDEVFFIGGDAAGYTAHISNITGPSSGVYTVTIDETIPTVTATNKSRICVQNWKKVGVISTSHQNYVKRYAQFPLSSAQKWIQFKFELRGEGVQIEELCLDQDADA